MNNPPFLNFFSLLSLRRKIVYLVIILLSGFIFLVPVNGTDLQITSSTDMTGSQPTIQVTLSPTAAVASTVPPSGTSEPAQNSEEMITIHQPAKSPVIPGFQPASEDDTIIRFGQMGIDTITMLGPSSVYDIAFRTPLSWNATGDAVLKLNYDLKEITDNGSRKGEVLPYLTFSVNGTVIQTSVLEKGEGQILEIIIPKDTLTNSKTHYYTLEIELFADWYCEHSGVIEVTISPVSAIQFIYEKQPLSTNLTDLPRPFYLSSSFVQIPSYLIIPDHSTENELSLLLDFIGTLGKLGSRTFTLKLLRFSEINDEILQNGNLIFFGTVKSFPGLDVVQFPISYSNGSFSSFQSAESKGGLVLGEDDGLLQIAVSPWNKYRMVLCIGGQTETGLAKAISSLSGNLNRYLIQDTLAVISEFPEPVSNTLIYDQPVTIKDLTQSDDIDLRGAGTLSFSFNFVVPQGFVSQTNASFTLRSFFSSVMDFGSSSISVYLNDILFSTFSFPDNENFLEKSVKLPSYAVRTGRNTIQIEAVLNAKRYCDSHNRIIPWITILNDSSLNLDLLQKEGVTLSKSTMAEFNNFPDALDTTSSLSNILWIIPENDMEAILTAAHLASELGAQSYVQGLKMQLRFASDTLNFSDLKDQDWIIIGNSQTLKPVIPKINYLLPIPFRSDMTHLNETIIFPNSRINSQKSYGYLECIINPDNPERSILLITGSNQDGFISAGNAFLQSNRRNISGNFASISDDFIKSENIDSIIRVTPTVVELVSQVTGNGSESQMTDSLQMNTGVSDTDESIGFFGLNKSDPATLLLIGVAGFNILFIIILILILIKKLIKK